MNHAAMLLDDALAPLAATLADPAVEDVAVNGEGAFWTRRAAWERHAAPSLDFETLEGIAFLCCALRRHTIGRAAPMGGGELHTGHRFQAVLPPAVPLGSASLTFRKPSADIAPISSISARYATQGWNVWQGAGTARRADSAELLALYDGGDVEAFLRAMARRRRTILFAGPTGAGKSTMSKTVLSEAPADLRIVTIEDAIELALRHTNAVRLLFGAGGDGAVKPGDCLHAALRMRPDLIPVQELREPYTAWVFLNEVSAGHPGSPSTIHGETAQQAARRLFALLKGSREGASISDDVLLGMIGAGVDCIMPIGTDGSLRRIGAVWFADDAARRGETVADLLRAAS